MNIIHDILAWFSLTLKIRNGNETYLSGPHIKYLPSIKRSHASVAAKLFIQFFLWLFRLKPAFYFLHWQATPEPFTWAWASHCTGTFKIATRFGYSSLAFDVTFAWAHAYFLLNLLLLWLIDKLKLRNVSATLDFSTPYPVLQRLLFLFCSY